MSSTLDPSDHWTSYVTAVTTPSEVSTLPYPTLWTTVSGVSAISTDGSIIIMSDNSTISTVFASSTPPSATSQSLTTPSWTLTLETTTSLPSTTIEATVTAAAVTTAFATVTQGEVSTTVWVAPTTSSTSTTSEEPQTPTSTAPIYTTTEESNCCPYPDAFCCNPFAAGSVIAAPTQCVAAGGVPYCGWRRMIPIISHTPRVQV